MGALMPQWNLDRTVNDVIGISRGIIEAASSDGIQVLALVASERFGTNVAMSQESCHKAYLLCSRSHESTVVSFLKAKIGYSEGDCGWQLSRTHAGLRYLGLVACLSTLGSWNAALILHGLIVSTAADKTLVPTVQHLKQLVVALESRLAKSGFSESVLGWSPILSKEMEGQVDAENIALTTDQRSATSPPPTNAIVGLTQAMSCLNRLGEEVRKIEITTTGDHAAWFVAFVKWSLGAPPTIVSYNGRTLVEADSQVIIRLIKSTRKPQSVRVDLHDYTGKIQNLVNTVSSNNVFKGLVGVGAYGQSKMRRRFGNADDLRHRACVQALPYACLQVRQCLIVRREWSYGSSLGREEQRIPDSIALKGQVFSSIDHMERLLQDYLGHEVQKTQPPLTQLRDGTLITDLPLMSLIKSQITQDCPCSSCQNTARNAVVSCKFKHFLHSISYCVADVLTLSLLDPIDPNGVQVYFGSDPSGPFDKHVYSIISGEGQMQGCSISDIIEYTVAILGHEVSNKHAWIMSSRFDQTVYPKFFSTQALNSEGILALECVPGSLMWKNERYANVVVSPAYQHWSREDEDSDAESETESMLQDQSAGVEGEAITPKDSYPGHKLQWQLANKENNLEVAVLQPKFPTFPGRNPRYALESAVESLYVDCNHDRSASFTPRNDEIRIAHPLNPSLPFRGPERVNIVQCDKNEPTRFFALAYGQPGVIRMNSCVECCVKHCHLAEARFVLC